MRWKGFFLAERLASPYELVAEVYLLSNLRVREGAVSMGHYNYIPYVIIVSLPYTSLLQVLRLINVPKLHRMMHDDGIIGSIELSRDEDESFSTLTANIILDFIMVATASHGSLVKGDNRPFLQDALQILHVLQAFSFGQSAADWRERFAIGEDEDCPDRQGNVLVGIFECDECGVVCKGHLYLFPNKICYI